MKIHFHDSHTIHAGSGKIPFLIMLLLITLPLWAIWYFVANYNATPKEINDITLSAAEQGKIIAAEQGCFNCHGPEGKGGVENPGHVDGFVPGWNSQDFLATYMYYPIVLRQEIERAIVPGMYQDPQDIGTQEFAPYKMQPWIGRLTTQQINLIMAYIYSINPAVQDKMRSILKGNYDLQEFAKVSGDINPAYVGNNYKEVTMVDGTPLGTPAVAQFPPGNTYPKKYPQYFERNKDKNPPQFVKDVAEFASLINLKLN